MSILPDESAWANILAETLALLDEPTQDSKVPYKKCSVTNSNQSIIGEDTVDYLMASTEKNEQKKPYPFLKTLPRRKKNENKEDHSYRVLGSLLAKRALRIMGQAEDHKSKETFLLLLAELRKFAPIAAERAGVSLTHISLNHEIERTMMWAAETFNPITYAFTQLKAEDAGRKTRFQKSDYLATRYMTVTSAAKALGCSRTTIYALRKRYEVTEEKESFSERKSSSSPERDDYFQSIAHLLDK